MEVMKLTLKKSFELDLNKYVGMERGEYVCVYSIDEIKEDICDEELRICEIVADDDVVGFVKMCEFYSSDKFKYVQAYKYDFDI